MNEENANRLERYQLPYERRGRFRTFRRIFLAFERTLSGFGYVNRRNKYADNFTTAHGFFT